MLVGSYYGSRLPGFVYGSRADNFWDWGWKKDIACHIEKEWANIEKRVAIEEVIIVSVTSDQGETVC